MKSFIESGAFRMNENLQDYHRLALDLCLTLLIFKGETSPVK